MNIKQYLADPDRQKQYAEWLRHPVTREFIPMIADELRPGGLPALLRTGEPALYYAGCVDTYNLIFQALLDLPSVVERQLIQRTVGQFLGNPDYGAKAIMERFNKGDAV